MDLKLVATMDAQLRKLDKLQARTWATAALGEAVRATPGPGDTAYATGHARASTRVSTGDEPERFDTGIRAVYPIPDRSTALRGLGGRRPFEDVHVAGGAKSKGGFFYGETVEAYHEPMGRAHKAGRAALREEHAANVQKAMRARA